MTKYPPPPLRRPLAPGGRIHPRPKPSGAESCLRTTGRTYRCDVCHTGPKTMHSPIQADGRFCPEHCPHCNQSGDPAR